MVSRSGFLATRPGSIPTRVEFGSKALRLPPVRAPTRTTHPLARLLISVTATLFFFSFWFWYPDAVAGADHTLRTSRRHVRRATARRTASCACVARASEVRSQLGGPLSPHLDRCGRAAARAPATRAPATRAPATRPPPTERSDCAYAGRGLEPVTGRRGELKRELVGRARDLHA